jgi:hypothetical protein
MFKNPRLKKVLHDDHGIDGDKNFRIFSGIWLPESKDLEKDLIFPEQSSFTCTHQDMTCQELSVTLGVIGPLSPPTSVTAQSLGYDRCTPARLGP